MTVTPEIPEEAIKAARQAIFEHTRLPDSDYTSVALLAVAAALPHLQPSGAAEDAEPSLIDLVRELRETLGMPSGALPISPKQTWDEAIARVGALTAGVCSACVRGDSEVKALAASVCPDCDALPGRAHSPASLTNLEGFKALAATTFELGRALGRKEAGEELADKIATQAKITQRVPVSERTGVREGMLVAWISAEKLARDYASQPPQAVSEPLTGQPASPRTPEGSKPSEGAL